ncbi:MAG: cellulase family glycosylhydrolase [Bacteroidales bacterium]
MTNKIGKLWLIITLIASPVVACAGNGEDDSASVTDLVRFCSERRGFNLLGKFDVSWSNQGFSEQDFQMIHDMGFNFVRLPLDYRTYTQAGNWNVFLENEVKEIDNAVAWGKKYGVHVCINLHRAPGYCVNAATLPVNQQLDLWTDTIAQNAFISHWEFFTTRYQDAPAYELSFNLVNEPSNVLDTVYLPIMRRAIQAIHAISPERLVFVDGLDYGRTLLPALKDEENVAQAIHCYDPFGLTHYRAEWVNGADSWPLPHWPMQWVSTYLYGPWKSSFKSALVINGSFQQGMEVIVNVRQVSTQSTLQIKADSKILLSKQFVCTADTGEDFSQVVSTEWGYQNISNKDFSTSLSSPATKLSFENTAGDWMTINSITLRAGSSQFILYPSDDTWGQKQSTYLLGADGVLRTPEGTDLLPFDLYRRNVDTARIYQIPFMVQEFGVYNKTPHEVTLAFLSDLTRFFRENGIGWALWNFSGSFGILDSDREDVAYKAFRGHRLDEELLKVLTIDQSAVGDKHTGKLMLYPVPARGELFLRSDNFSGKTSIRIYDLAGRLMKSCRVETSGNPFLRLDVSGFQSSLYLLQAENKGLVFSGKFLVE